MGSTAVKNTVCLPSFVSFPPANQTCSKNRIAATGRTNVIDVLSPLVRDFHIVLQRQITFISSRAALDGTHVKNVIMGDQAILKSVLIPSSLQKQKHGDLGRKAVWCEGKETRFDS